MSAHSLRNEILAIGGIVALAIALAVTLGVVLAIAIAHDAFGNIEGALIGEQISQRQLVADCQGNALSATCV